MTLRTICAFLATLSFTIPASAATIQSQEELDRLIGGFYGSTSIDDSALYDVKDLLITSDIATFNLKTGTLHLTKPIEGIVATAVFIGEGTVSIKPTRPMDRLTLDLASQEHLHKTLGGELNTAFSEMVIVSFDDTLDKIVKSPTVKIGSGDAAGASGVLKDRLDVMRGLEAPFDTSLVQKKLGMPGGDLYIDFKTADHGWLDYGYLAREQYEVNLTLIERVGALYVLRPLIRTHKSFDFDPKGNYIADAVKDQKPWVDILNYKMEITIPDTSHFLVEADVTFTPQSEDLPLVYFDLVNTIYGRKSTDKGKEIFLNKVTDASGKAIPYKHIKNRAWIAPPEPLKVGQSHTWHFTLDEQTIIQLSSVHYLVLNTYPWFPQHGYAGGVAKMDWTIKAKKPLTATGSGRIVKEGPEGPYNVTQLVLDEDVWFPSLIFGQYQKVTDVYQSAVGGANVDLAVYSWPRTSFNVLEANPPQTVDVTVPGGKPKDVLSEAKEILKFEEALYGSFPYKALYVAQMSPGLGFGQAPPGFVQLTGEAFMSSATIASLGGANADFFHEFFSHEISHQWWGHAIKWASDEDVWLSESYAEYTAGLYVMQLLGQDRFQGKLKEWRDEAKIADPHAPIAWANNVSGQNAGAWRTGLIYNKGPYVVHMLRMQVGHENFVKAMKNLTTKYRYQMITTDQLRQEFELVVGYKLDYFFDQWFRRTGIPVFDYSTSIRPTEDGKWLATITTSQRDKANFKIVSLPVFFHFGKDKVIVKDRPIMKADDVYQVKLQEKPNSITLDDYKTLLADFVGSTSAGQ